MYATIIIICLAIGLLYNYRGVRYWWRNRGLAGLMRDKLNYNRKGHPMARPLSGPERIEREFERLAKYL